MKKLMTMIAAVATAFGLFADDPEFKSGTDFNLFTPGPFNTAEDTSATRWTGVDTDDEIVTATWEMPADIGVPEEYAESGNGKCLKIKTTLGNPIAREVTQIVADNVFVDFLTEMTVFDEAPASFGTGAKVAVWLQEATNTTGDVTGTNVWLHAGKFNAQGAVEAFDYDCGDASQYAITDWNRVTVKAIADIDGNNAGFVVFINKNALKLETYDIGKAPTAFNAKAQKWITARALFPSLGAAGISALGFDGQGQVDDIAFTTIVPGVEAGEDWAKDDDVYTVTWTGVKANLASLTIDGNVVDPTTGSYTGVIPASKKVVIAWTGTDGFIDGSKTAENVGDLADLTLTADDVKPAVASVDGLKLALLSDAVATANVATVDCELKLLADATAQVTFENASAKITIDLNSHALQAFMVNSGDVIVDDSAGGGKIDGEVFVDDSAATLLFNAGKVKYAGNENLLDFTTISVKDGYKFEKQDDYWVLVVKPYEFTGSGTEADPYIIDCVKALQLLKEKVDAGEEPYTNAFYRQTADIDLTDVSDWTGIGEINSATASSAKSFAGVYDGGNFKVTTFIQANNSFCGALFNDLNGATIKNLEVENSQPVGVVVKGGAVLSGALHGDCVISNVTVSGSFSGTHNCGGFVVKAAGAAESKHLFVDCTNKCAITDNRGDAGDKVGGFVGFLWNDARGIELTFERCANTADVTGAGSKVFGVGGFVGNDNSGVIKFKDCANTGTVTGATAGSVGTFVGSLSEGVATAGKLYLCNVIDLGGNTVTAAQMIGGGALGADLATTTAAATTIEGFFQAAAGGTTVAAPTAGEYKVLTATNMTALAITDTLTLTSAAGFGGEVTSADDTKKVEVNDQGATKVYTLVNKSTPIDPTKPSDPVEVTGGQEAADAAAAKWVADNGVAPADNDVAALLDTDEKKKAYSALFTGKATNVSGDSYVFSVVLAPATVAIVQPVANKAAADVVDAFASETPAVTVNTIPGLYYGVGEAATVGADKVVGTWVLGDGSAKTLTFTKQGDARFYQVKVKISK